MPNKARSTADYDSQDEANTELLESSSISIGVLRLLRVEAVCAVAVRPVGSPLNGNQP